MNEEFKIVLRNIRSRRLRSWLTIIGILIGIAAVVSLISLGKGFDKAVKQEFEKIGGDKIIITPVSAFYGLPSGTNKLTEKDKKAIEGVVGVKTVAMSSFTTAVIEWKDMREYNGIFSIPEGDERRLVQSMQNNVDIIEGRNLKDDDKYKAVLGYDYAREEVYKKKLNVGDSFTINKKRFVAVGRMSRVGNSIDDKIIMIPTKAYDEIFNTTGTGDYLFVQITNADRLDEIADSIKRELRKLHNVKEGEEDFTVQTPEEILESFGNIFNIITIVLVGIAAVSLIVGGVGIANTMYTAILERTREIGVMKAIGADRKNIILIFMIESGLLGMIGGILGAILGVIVSTAIAFVGGNIIGTPLLKADITLWLVIGAILFSFLVGCIAGTLPAIQASKLDPVEALQYE